MNGDSAFTIITIRIQ